MVDTVGYMEYLVDIAWHIYCLCRDFSLRLLPYFIGLAMFVAVSAISYQLCGCYCIMNNSIVNV